jgi:4-hydroxy-tetrahydrodipicolinate synthase
VTPYYNRPSQDGLIRHYESIAASTPLPIVLYNVPTRTGCNLEPKTVQRLASVPNIVAIKEASGSVAQISQLLALVPDDFIVLSGDDPMTLPMMALGAHGVISVSSNLVPGLVVKMVEAAERGDFDAARRQNERLLFPTLALFAESNPIPVKAAMAMLGLIEETYRLPLVAPSAATRERLNEALAQLELTPVRQTT